MQRTSDDRLRLALLGDDDRFQPMFAGTDPTIFSDEIGVARSLHEELSHDGVVVIRRPTHDNRCRIWFRKRLASRLPCCRANLDRLERCAAHWC